MSKLLASLICGLLLIPAAYAQDAPPKAEVRVNTTPTGASIYANDRIWENTPVTITSLPPGKHLIIAKKEGFKDARETIEITAGDKSTVTLKLEEITGLALIETTPTGADIEIDGAHVGESPQLITHLALGTYRAKLSKAGYTDKEIEFSLENRRPVHVKAELASSMASLNVASSPSGASVTLDGLDHGKTPAQIQNIEAGDHELKLTAAGYVPYTQKINLVAGNEPKDITIKMQELPSSLKVVTIPQKARVYINNAFRGESPVTLKNIKSGDYRIRVELKGHEPDARNVTIKAGSNPVEEFRMTRNSGIFRLITQPAGVAVFIDGESHGVTKATPGGDISEPLEINTISEGKHRLQLSKKGYETINSTFNLTRDKVSGGTVKLQQLFIKDTVLKLISGKEITGMRLPDGPNGVIVLRTTPGVTREFEPKDIISLKPILDPE